MKGSDRLRPCWVVLVAGPRKVIEKVVLSIKNHSTIEVSEGKADYVAVIEHERGSESIGDKLGERLSKDMTKPVYVMWLNEEIEQVQVLEKGNSVGRVKESPDDVARELGCSFPQMTSGRGKVDLTPSKPTKKRGELTIGGWTIPQWEDIMDPGTDWAAMLDGVSAKTAAEALAALDHADKGIRGVAVRLVKVIIVGGFGDKAPDALAALRRLAKSDPDKDVRAAAKKAAETVARDLE